MWVEDTPNFLQTFLPGWIFLVCPEGRSSIRAFGSPSCGSWCLRRAQPAAFPFSRGTKRFWQLVLDATECLCACIEYKTDIKLIDITLNMKWMLNSTKLYLNLFLFSYFSGWKREWIDFKACSGSGDDQYGTSALYPPNIGCSREQK